MNDLTRIRLEEMRDDLDDILAEAKPAGLDNSPAWLSTARGELGVREIRGDEDNPRIVEYHATTGLSADDDETPWCSSFVNWCVTRSGLDGTNSARARSWLNWGNEVRAPLPGCVVVLSRPPKPASGHVGFFISETDDQVMLLGGNQNNAVSIKPYPKDRVLSYRWPVL